MEPRSTIAAIRSLMLDYASITGLHPPGATPRRYLWTDAFAVCNLLELFRQTGDRQWLDLACRLVDQVHHNLGRHRGDDPRSGWISGLSDAEGEAHPTRGGLRIGKRLNERGPGDRPDERLEWEQDGQYFHYLTKWMHALGRMSRVSGNTAYAGWAVELAQAAQTAFTAEGGRRMYWKMSIDLTRPLVPSMGQHDPLDGYITFSELQALATGSGLLPRSSLAAEIVAMAAICAHRDWATDDPLGIGGLLSDAWRIAQLTDLGLFTDRQLLESVIDGALAGLAAFTEGSPLNIPADYRLAFRELGLAIGLKGVTSLRDWAEKNSARSQTPLQRKIVALAGYLQLAGEIEDFWLEGSNREAGTWREHREINMVMLATSLAPDGFLSI
ncbi:MAG TPA: hypothetical protein VIU41_14295 [Geobacteraceae bacterium]